MHTMNEKVFPFRSAIALLIQQVPIAQIRILIAMLFLHMQPEISVTGKALTTLFTVPPFLKA